MVMSRFIGTRSGISSAPFAFIGLFLAAPLPGQAHCPNAAELTRGLQPPLSHVRYLADDALEGRETGTQGGRCAAEYIAERFRLAALSPVAAGSFFQPFPVRAGSVLGAGNRLEASGAEYTLLDDWVPFGFSEPVAVTAHLVYGQHGISDLSDPHGGSGGPDVSGHILVVEDGDPSSATGRSLQADPHFKASVAAGRGAVAIVVLLPEGAGLPDPSVDQRPSAKIPALAVKGDAARAVRRAAREGALATLSIDVAPRMVEARNVAAILPGADPARASEVVVVGAHYDHLGFGGDGSLAPDERQVHNGADDNASGTAAMLTVAEMLARAPSPPARTVLFVAFTGEEKGLWGSARYVSEPLLPLDRTEAMVNMDMVGRLREDKLTVFGSGTAEEWDSVLSAANDRQSTPLQLILVADGYGPSDHSSFYGKGIPVLHFFTNTHEDYHRPTDDWEKIDADGLGRVTALVFDVVGELAGRAGDPAARIADLTLIEGAGNPNQARPGLPDAGDSPQPQRGYGPYLGTIPDMTPSDFGVRLTGVREGSPAQEAGIRSGDVIVEFAGREISDLYAYTYALREHAPGDEVEIVVLRDGERVKLTAVLGAR